MNYVPASTRDQFGAAEDNNQEEASFLHLEPALTNYAHGRPFLTFEAGLLTVLLCREVIHTSTNRLVEQ